MRLTTRKLKDGSFIVKELNHFRLDRQDGKGFDMDLLSIDSVYWDHSCTNVYYASRDWSFRATKFTGLLQRVFGVNK